MRRKFEPSKRNGATVLSRALESKGKELPPEGARFILSLGIRDEDKRRLLERLDKHQNCQITAEELDDLESYLQADHVLSVLNAQSVLTLKQARRKP